MWIGNLDDAKKKRMANYREGRGQERKLQEKGTEQNSLEKGGSWIKSGGWLGGGKLVLKREKGKNFMGWGGSYRKH